MKQHHLNDEQLAAWACGERETGAAQHLRECPECLAEVSQLNAALDGFKAEVNERAEARVPFTGAQLRARANEARPARSLWRLLPVPALAAAAVLAIMLSNSAPAPSPSPAAHDDAADDALLLAISSDVYRTTPAALRPAASLNRERNQILNSSQKK